MRSQWAASSRSAASVADRDDSVGEQLLSGGAMRRESLRLSASVRRVSSVREISPALGRRASHALMNTPSRRQERNVAEADIQDIVGRWGDLLKIASVFGL